MGRDSIETASPARSPSPRKSLAAARGLVQRLAPHEWLLVACLVGFAWHYFWLMDDAFIYFRYADNLLFLRRGLVFNAGEYVEGYTSPAWMMLLLPLRAARLDYFFIVRALSVVCAGVYGGLLVCVNRALAPAGAERVNLPLAIAAAHYGITEHFSSGLETPLVQVWSVLLALWTLSPSSTLLALLAGAAPLVRPELALAAAVCGVAVWFSRRRFPTTFALSALGFNTAWLAFRVYYYADLLPNTFHLKGQPDWMQGLWYLACGVLGQHWIWILPVAWLLLATRASSMRRREHRIAVLAMIVSAVLLLAWVTRIGGDMMYHRFLAAPTTLLLCSIGGIAEGVLAGWSSSRLRPYIGYTLAAGAFLASFASYPPTLDRHPLLHPKTRHFHNINEAHWHRLQKDLAPPLDPAAADRAVLASYATISETSRAQVQVLVHPWCKRAYTDYRKYVINTFGLTDAVLARIDAPFARPGHKSVGLDADQLGTIVGLTHGNRAPGMYRRAVKLRKAPAWVRRNLPALELLERKIYNHHDFLENLRLALQPVPRIRLG